MSTIATFFFLSTSVEVAIIDCNDAGMESTHALELEIRAAFTSRVAPRSTEIALNRKEDLGTSDDGDFVASFFEGKLWESLDISTLHRYPGDTSAALTFMTHNARRYFLPAFLILALKHPEEGNHFAGTIFWLIPPSPADRSYRTGDLQAFYDWIDGFTKEERSAIAHFLQYHTGKNSESTYNEAIKVWEGHRS